MRSKLNSLGMSLFVASLVIPIILMVSELQAWTAAAFQTTEPSQSAFGPSITNTEGGYTDPAVALNFSGDTATWLMLMSAAAAIGAALLLLGHRRLLAISGLWLLLGVCLNGHLYADIDKGAWLILAIIPGVAAFMPDYSVYRRRQVPDTAPSERTVISRDELL